jgi:protein-tyrosine phosphatase
VIDSHCHLLSGLDDGPRRPEESVALARVLEADGVTTVVCTPHWSRAFPTAWPDVLAATERARRDLAAAGVALELVPASELSPAVAVTAPLEQIAERAVGGRYVVVEAVADTPAPFFASVLDRLRPAGLAPVFAHPERSRAVQRDPALLAAARRDGALVQTVAPSLVGRWGRDVARTAWTLVERDLTDLVGSDAHGVRSRRSHLPEAATALAERVGRERADELTLQAPRRLLDGAA